MPGSGGGGEETAALNSKTIELMGMNLGGLAEYKELINLMSFKRHVTSSLRHNE